MHEDRDEVGHRRVPQQVFTYTRELPVDELWVKGAELACDLVLGLLHPLLKRLVSLSNQGTGILTQSVGARQVPRADDGCVASVNSRNSAVSR